MEDLECSKIDAETDDFSLIDNSASDDDFLLASSSEPCMMEDQGNVVKTVPSNQPSDSSRLHKAKSGKCNLRKSLAWDSAFFTNAGVLDPEELSSIIEGTETSAKNNLSLPGIQEELSKSSDSISTFQSDNATLESLEADLFSDIRASIQKSSKSSTTGSGCVSEISGEEGSKIGFSKKIIGPSSRQLAKPTSISNKMKPGLQGPVRSLKPNSVNKQVTKPPVNYSREPSSTLPRLPKAAAGSSLPVATATKRMSVDAGRVKHDVKAAGNVKGKGVPVSVASHQVASKKILPKIPAVSKVSAVLTRKPLPKASADSLVMNNRTSSHSSRSSCDSSSSSASENVRKSQPGVIRRKTDKSVNLTSGSKIRTSSKVVEKVESQNNESRLSAYVKSTSKLSSSISPASSISEWSTESSSSMATANQNHLGLNRCSPSSQDGAVDRNASRNLHKLSRDKALSAPDSQVIRTSGESLKQPSTGSDMSSMGTGSAKPSGLRMPSPNIGFFDGAKAGAKTPSSNSRSRSALPSSLPRSVAGSSSSSGSFNKTKLGTSASKMLAAVAGTAKPKQPVTGANRKAAVHLLDHSTDLKKSSAVKLIDKDSEISYDFPRNDPLKPALEIDENAPGGPDPAIYFTDSQLVIGKDNLASDDLSIETSSEFARSISPKSNLERNNEVSEASNLRKNAPGLWLEQDYEDGLQNPLSTSSELPNSNLSKPALEKVSEVAFISDGGKQSLELASVTKDNLVASEKETIPVENVVSTIHLENANDCSGNSSELPESTLVNSAFEKYCEVGDGEKHAPPDSGSVAMDELIAPNERNLNVTSNHADVASENGFAVLDTSPTTSFASIPSVSSYSIMEQGVNSNTSAVYNSFSSSQHIDETNIHEVVSQLKQDEGGSVENGGATDETQCSEIVCNDLSPSQHINETDIHEVVSQLKQQDEGGSVENGGATDETRCSEIVCNDLSPSQHINETDIHEVVSQLKQDEGGSVENGGATDETQCSEIVCNNLSPSQHINETDCLEVISQHGQQFVCKSVVHGDIYATNENHCSEIVRDNLSLSRHIDEINSLEAVSQHTQQDKAEIGEHGATHGNNCLETGLVEIKIKPCDLEVISQHNQQDEGGSEEHDAKNKNQCSEIVPDNLSLSQHINEIYNNLESVSQDTQQDKAEIGEHVAIHENDCLETGSVEIKAKSCDLEVISQHNQQDEGGSEEHDAMNKNQCSEIVPDNLSLSQHVDEINKLESVTQYTKQDKAGIVQHGATGENHCLENGSAKIKESVFSENKVEESDMNLGPTENKVNTQEESDKNVQSESAEIAVLITCSPTSPTSGDDSVGRTPFTIKNTMPNVVEVKKSPFVSATEASMKVDAVVPSLEKSEKENS